MRKRTWIVAVTLAAACSWPGIRPAGPPKKDMSGASDPPSARLLRQQLDDDEHLDDVGLPLLRAAASQCAVNGRRAGIRISNLPTVTRPWQPFARELGFTDTVLVLSVAKGGGADRAGMRARDRLVSLDGIAAVPGSRIVGTLRDHLIAVGDRDVAAIPATVRRDGREIALTVPLDSMCAISFLSWREDGPDAWSDGRSMAVTTSMLAFARSDDELAVVLAHEIAHAIVRRENDRSPLTKLADASAGVALGAVGFAADDRWVKMKVARPSEPVDSASERRADEWTAKLLRSAGRPVAAMHAFWRHSLSPDPSEMPYVRIHPLSIERLWRLEALSTGAKNAAAGDRPNASPGAPSR